MKFNYNPTEKSLIFIAFSYKAALFSKNVYLSSIKIQIMSIDFETLEILFFISNEVKSCEKQWMHFFLADLLNLEILKSRRVLNYVRTQLLTEFMHVNKHNFLINWKNGEQEQLYFNYIECSWIIQLLNRLSVILVFLYI